MEKKYLILGDNNFWYSLCDKKDIDNEINIIKHNIKIYGAGNSQENFTPDKLYVYKVKEIKEIDL